MLRGQNYTIYTILMLKSRKSTIIHIIKLKNGLKCKEVRVQRPGGRRFGGWRSMVRSRSYVEVTTIDSEHFLWRKVFSEWSRNRFPLYILPEVERLLRLIRLVWEAVIS